MNSPTSLSIPNTADPPNQQPAREIANPPDAVAYSTAHGFAALADRLIANGYTPIISGSTYIQAVTWGANGPVARGILTYSQSTDPASKHAADQTALYSTGQWYRLPFSSAEIAADPALVTVILRE